jgi:hypothetical protein
MLFGVSASAMSLIDHLGDLDTGLGHHDIGDLSLELLKPPPDSLIFPQS